MQVECVEQLMNDTLQGYVQNFNMIILTERIAYTLLCDSMHIDMITMQTVLHGKIH